VKNGSIVLVIALGSSICPDNRNALAFLRCYPARTANAMPRGMAPQKKNGLEAGEGGLAMGGGLAVRRLRALPRAQGKTCTRQGQNEHTQHANSNHLPFCQPVPEVAQHFLASHKETKKSHFLSSSLFERIRMRGVIILACLVCWSSGFSLTKLPLSRVGCSLGMSSSRVHLAQSISMSSVEDAARMARRDAVLSALAAVATIPTAARADDAADFEKLRQEAARISGLIEKTKQASLPDAPSFGKNAVKIPEAKPKVAEAPKATKPSGPKPDPKLEPKQVVKVILELLINNDNPSENAGMKTVLDFSSSVNPYVNQPPERFFQAMRNSAYSILLGGYEDAKVGKPDVGKGDDGVPYQVICLSIYLYTYIHLYIHIYIHTYIHTT